MSNLITNTTISTIESTFIWQIILLKNNFLNTLHILSEAHICIVVSIHITQVLPNFVSYCWLHNVFSVNYIFCVTIFYAMLPWCTFIYIFHFFLHTLAYYTLIISLCKHIFVSCLYAYMWSFLGLKWWDLQFLVGKLRCQIGRFFCGKKKKTKTKKTKQTILMSKFVIYSTVDHC